MNWLHDQLLNDDLERCWYLNKNNNNNIHSETKNKHTPSFNDDDDSGKVLYCHFIYSFKSSIASAESRWRVIWEFFCNKIGWKLKFEPEYEFESEYECIISDMNLGMDWDVSGFENPDPGLYPALFPDWDLDRNIIAYYGTQIVL